MIGQLINSGRGIGFDFDQVTEPSNPSIGQLWRERSVGGLIVGEWEWNGAIWWGRLIEVGNISVSGLTANSSPSLSGSIDVSGSIWAEVSVRYYLPSADGTNRWSVALRRLVEQPGGTISASTTATFLTLDTGLTDWREASATAIVAASTGRELIGQLSINRINTPGNLSANFVFRYRRIR